MSFEMQQEIDKIRRTCILCGRCTAVCPSFKHGGIDPMEIMAGGEEGLDQCIMCGNCQRICRRSDPFTVIRGLIYMQNSMSVSDTFKQTGFTRAPAADRCIEASWEGDDVCVMLGCVVDGMAPFIEYAAAEAMKAVGVGAYRLPGEMCCLHPIQFLGMPEHEKRDIKIGMCDSAEGRDIVTLCAGCSEELQMISDGTKHIIEFLYGHLDDLPSFDRRIKVGMEPGCSAENLMKEMKAVLERMNCEIVNTTVGCCGKNAPVNIRLMKEREEECADADIIVVGCPMCFIKYDSQENGIPVAHIAELVAMAAGKDGSMAFHRIGFRL